MYRLSVPVRNGMVQKVGKETILDLLRRMGAERVFLSIDTYVTDRAERARELEMLEENSRFFHENGLETGVWLWTFTVEGDHDFTLMESLEGGPLPQKGCCPLDERFRQFAGEYMEDLAGTGVDIILFDDDYRYGFRDGMGCACGKHLRKMGEILGEELTADKLREKAFAGGKNPYRDAYLAVNGQSLELFAREMRAHVDRVNPRVRLGVCACMSLWDNDGIDAASVSRILAGDTKPFLRLIGAPYWAPERYWGNRLQHVIELSRMERSWCGEGIEVIGEGDSCPRLRHKTPASYLELFDMALRADGTVDGILKYVMTYYLHPDYEKGYVERHCRNRALYAAIEENFSGKEACGVRVYESMKKFADMVIPGEKAGSCDVENAFFPIAARMLADNSLPTVYEGEGVCGIAFGENIKMVPDSALRRGVIIDAEAARLLGERGIDTGIRRMVEKVTVKGEYFAGEEEFVYGAYTAHVMELDGRAEVDSSIAYMEDGQEKKAPGAFFYENGEGHRFWVFAFDAYFNNENMYRSYSRARQLVKAVGRLTGRALPACSLGNPDLYLLCKQDERELAVGLWNICPDGIYEPVVELEHACRGIRFLNCRGRLEGNRVYLSQMEPFSFAGFVAET